jgi:diguanylate cyclase (GGDEF)-like protein
MRFRHKLTIMLVVLALVPLVASGLLATSLLRRNQVAHIDGRLGGAVSSGVVAYGDALRGVQQRGVVLAHRKAVQDALTGKGDPNAVVSAPPPGRVVQLVSDGQVIAGTPPPGPAWKAQIAVGPASAGDSVIVWQPLDRGFLERVQRRIPDSPGVDLGLVARARIAASTDAASGRVSPIVSGVPYDATFGGTGVRAAAVPVPASKGGPVRLFATYPSSQLADSVRSAQLKVLIPLGAVCLLVALLAVFAAGRISQALTELSVRARGLLRPGSVPENADELSELSAVIDHMSTELSTRVDELEAERGRVKQTLRRYGDTLAATHDLDALVGAVLDTAVQATRAGGGRLLLYDPDKGSATEQARIGTALGSRTDLPVEVTAGTGLEGLALAEMAPRRVILPRAILTAPIVREEELLGLVTVVDPADGYFGSDDVETLSGLAVQAGVAIENARLHRVVEQQAVTDALTGLANRRQFFDALGRELERAQRFEQETALILFDLDDFKTVNDTLGHLAGDAVLHAVARTVQGLIREIDVAARYGGEEFAVLLPQTDREGAANLAERLRIAIAEVRVEFAGKTIEGITASFGVAAGPDAGTTQLDLIAIADAALYAAKHRGKNTVA